MNFLAKARRKVESTLNEIQANSQLGGSAPQPQSHPQNSNQNSRHQYQQAGHNIPTTPTQPPPLQEHQWQQQQQYQPYSAPPPNHAPSQQYSPPPSQGWLQQPQSNFAPSPNDSSSQQYPPPHLNQNFQPQSEYQQRSGHGQSFYQQPYVASPQAQAPPQAKLSEMPTQPPYQSPPIPQLQPYSNPISQPPTQQQQYMPPQPPHTAQTIPQSHSSSLHQPQIPQPAQPHQHSQPSNTETSSLEEQFPCLGTEGARTKAVQFFTLRNSEDFAICSNCYISKISRHHELASNFVLYQSKGRDESSLCAMVFPRSQQVLISQCVPRNTLQPLKDLFTFIATLTPCTGSVINSPGPMYIMRNQESPGFAMCPTCFELSIRTTVFEAHFENKTWPETRDWSCDFGAGTFIKKILKLALQSSPPSFADFANEAEARMQSPPCSGLGKPVPPLPKGQYIVYTPAEQKTGRACLECYSENMALTSLNDVWVPAQIEAGDVGKVGCDLASPFSKMAMAVAVKQGNDEVWRKAVGMEGKVGSCHSHKGQDEANLRKEVAQKGGAASWYEMNGYPNVMACPHCYWLAVNLCGAAHLCSPITRPLTNGIIRQCAWSGSTAPNEASTTDSTNFQTTTEWRGRRLRNALAYSWETQDWSELQAEVASISVLPPACGGQSFDRGFKLASGRKWYGRIRPNKNDPNDTTVVMCEECFTNAVKGLPYESLFNADLTKRAYAEEGDTGFLCQPYSNRARSYLRAAAESGDLATFAKYWNMRLELQKRRAKWLPILRAQNTKMAAQMQQNTLQMMKKVAATVAALQMIGSSGVSEAVSGDTGYRYGNSTIGYNYSTQNRADAEMAFHDAQNMPVGGGFGVEADSGQILALYQIDNKAYLAVE